jgi:hypothetical protein
MRPAKSFRFLDDGRIDLDNNPVEPVRRLRRWRRTLGHRLRSHHHRCRSVPLTRDDWRPPSRGQRGAIPSTLPPTGKLMHNAAFRCRFALVSPKRRLKLGDRRFPNSRDMSFSNGHSQRRQERPSFSARESISCNAASRLVASVTL